MSGKATPTDEQLMAQRARRTGRALPVSPTGDESRGPGQPTIPADPLGDFGTLAPPAATPPAATPPAATPPAATPSVEELQAQMAQLRQQLSAAQGRVAPTQQQLTELQAANAALLQSNTALQAAAAAAQAAQAEAAAAREAEGFDPFEGISADDLAALDPAVVTAMRTSARRSLTTVLKQRTDPSALVANALAERDRRSRDSFIAQESQALGLTTLGNEAAFTTFLANDDSAELLLSSFVRAPDLDTARGLLPRVKGMLTRYRNSLPAAPGAHNADDPASRVSAHLARSAPPAGTSAASVAPATPESVAALRAQHAAAVRRRDFKKAAELLARLNQ